MPYAVDMRRFAFTATSLAITFVFGVATTGMSQWPFVFENATKKYGLDRPLQGVMAHAMTVGDIDNDGDLDIYLGTFCDRPRHEYVGRNNPPSNMLLINNGGRFTEAGFDHAKIGKRTSGAGLVDFDNDGDLDLYVSNNSTQSVAFSTHNRLYENIDGKLHDVSEGNAASIVMGGRGIGVLDYNGDGLLDLLVLEDYWQGGHSRLFKNIGNLKFVDVTDAAGLNFLTDVANNVKLRGLGVVTPDFNGDGWPDLFISESNVMLLNDGRGRFERVNSSAFSSALEPRRGQYVAGVTCKDLDNDADLDIVTVDHTEGAGMHVYMNQGLVGGVPMFVEVTVAAGLDYKFAANTRDGLFLRHDHVEICDFDNDGRRDIMIAATYNDGTGSKPFVCYNHGGRDGAIRFYHPPTENADAHYPAGAIADYDRDGRMDVFLASWFPVRPSALLLNRTPTNGHWLQVAVRGTTINRMGVGSKIRIFQSQRLGDPNALLGYDEICITQGYCTVHEAVCHFGLGGAKTCDVEVVLPYGKGTITRRNVPTNQRLVIHPRGNSLAALPKREETKRNPFPTDSEAKIVDALAGLQTRDQAEFSPLPKDPDATTVTEQAWRPVSIPWAKFPSPGRLFLLAAGSLAIAVGGGTLISLRKLLPHAWRNCKRSEAEWSSEGKWSWRRGRREFTAVLDVFSYSLLLAGGASGIIAVLGFATMFLSPAGPLTSTSGNLSNEAPGVGSTPPYSVLISFCLIFGYAVTIRSQVNAVSRYRRRLRKRSRQYGMVDNRRLRHAYLEKIAEVDGHSDNNSHA